VLERFKKLCISWEIYSILYLNMPSSETMSTISHSNGVPHHYHYHHHHHQQERPNMNIIGDPVKSCERCRCKKRKCDRKLPSCSNCLKATELSMERHGVPIPCIYKPFMKRGEAKVLQSGIIFLLILLFFSFTVLSFPILCSFIV